jgi:predicted unusual protein kinase regulating ubiquinone biosynthesis (AarF/ABC1/UbiB family)
LTRKIPKTRIVRALKPAMTSARAALTYGRGRDIDKVIRSAQQVADLMGEMKGAFMKVGQLLSFADTSMLPPEIRDVLATLQADAPPMAYELVAEVVEAELGKPPDEAFDWFSRAPMAAASIGQVHAARLGEDEVVVKVQYPGVADAVAADLNNAGLMAGAMSVVQPLVRAYMGRVDVKALADEVRDRVLEELDYVGEAANQRTFGDTYRDHPFISVPAVVDSHSTGRVLTSAYHDGMRWAAAVQEDQPLRDRWGEVVYRFGFGSMYRYGLANADPHPGNYLFHEDGTVTFLDFGCIKRFPAAAVDHVKEIGRSLLAEDAGRLATAMAAGRVRPVARRRSPGPALRRHAVVVHAHRRSPAVELHARGGQGHRRRQPRHDRGVPGPGAGLRRAARLPLPRPARSRRALGAERAAGHGHVALDHRGAVPRLRARHRDGTARTALARGQTRPRNTPDTSGS